MFNHLQYEDSIDFKNWFWAAKQFEPLKCPIGVSLWVDHILCPPQCQLGKGFLNGRGRFCGISCVRAGQERNERNGGGGEVPSITLVSVG